MKASGHEEIVLKTKSETRKEKDKVTQLLSALRFVLLDKDGKCIAVMCIYGTNSCLFSLQDDNTVKSVLDDLLSIPKHWKDSLRYTMVIIFFMLLPFWRLRISKEEPRKEDMTHYFWITVATSVFSWLNSSLHKNSWKLIQFDRLKLSFP